MINGIFLITALLAPFQAASGQITGVVRDQAGTAAAGVTVTVTATDTNVSRTAVTNTDGVYKVTALVPGGYAIDVRQAGALKVKRSGLRIVTGETTVVDVSLPAGQVTDTISVTADVPQLRTDRASLGQAVGHEQIVQLPLNGRTFIQLAALAPGVALPQGSLLPRINGGRPRTNEYLFDGISVLQPEPGQVAFMPVVDSIQEFRIESNSPPAEFGRFNGGVVNLTMRSGTNDLGGTIFNFGRHEALNARNYFQKANPVKPKFRREQFGGVLGGPVARDTTFFFTDYQGQRQTIARTMISTVPTLLQRQGIFTEPLTGSTPTLIFDPATTTPSGSSFTRTAFLNNAIPSTRWDPVAAALLQRFPAPTSSGVANNFRRTADELDNQDQWDGRVDHRLNRGRDSMFARLSYFNGRFSPVTPLPEGSGTLSTTTTFATGPQDTNAWSFASQHQHVFSDRVLHELRIGDTRRSVDRRANALASPVAGALSLPGIPGTAQFPNTLPTFTVTGYQILGSAANTASLFGTHVTEIADALTVLRGKHTLKMGADLRWERVNVIQPPSPTGAFTFTNLFTDQGGQSSTTGLPLASFLLGQVQNFSIDLQNDEIRNRAHIQEYFIQDDWRVSDRMTVNAGVRYTLNFPSTEESNQAAVFNLQTKQLEYLGKNGMPRSARELHKLNVGPRAGITRRFGTKTVARAGYGLVFIEQAGITTPFTTPAFPFLQTAAQRTLDNINPAFVLANGPSVAPVAFTPDAGRGQGVFAVNRSLGSGYVQQWNISVQREITRNTSVEVAYVGSHITNVGVPDANINQLTPTQLAQGQSLLARVPNPYFGIIPTSSSLGDPTITVAQLMLPFPDYTGVSVYRNNIGTTDYKGVTMKVEQRLSRGLSYLVSYTRSRLIDDASSVFDASVLTGPILNAPVADAFDRKRDRDVSTGDIPNVFVANAVWQLPIGPGRWLHAGGVIGAALRDWSVSAIVTMQSGIPVAVTQSNQNAFAGFGTQRPNLVGDPNLPKDQRTPAHWFDPAAFVTAPRFTLGSASRNPVRAPSYRNVDVALSRRVDIGGGRKIEGRIEAFNLTNIAQFGAPNTSAGTPAFGTIIAAADPRVLQFAVKVIF